MDPRRRARLILIVGVLLALLAGGGTFLYASAAQSAAPGPAAPTTDVLVATRDIPARTELTAADVKVAKVNVDAAPPAAITTAEEAVGMVLIQDVAVNEPILASKFAPADRAFTVFPPGEELEPGSPSYRVMTITVPDNFAVGGILAPGDNVDIMYVFEFDLAKVDLGTAAGEAPPEDSDFTADSVAKIILGPMAVLARNAEVYTIRVDAPLAERLAYLQAAGGTLQMLLRAPGDDRAAGTEGATFETVFDSFSFPIPELVPAP